MHSKREKIDKPGAGSSVLQGDEKFLKKILSRNSSVGRVSKHYQKIGEVPFQWETIPGTPRNNLSSGKTVTEFDRGDQEEEINVRPVRPPPVVESSSMPKPIILSKKGKSSLHTSSFWRKKIWNRSKKIHQENKDHHLHAKGNRPVFGKSESFKFSNSDGADFMRPSTSNSSSSSSLSSFADDHGAVKSSKLKGLVRKIANWAF